MIVIALWVPYLATKGSACGSDSYLAEGGEKSRGTAVLGHAKLAAHTGAAVSALLGGAVVTLSYGHLLWANSMLSWIPVLLALRLTEPPAALDRGKKRAEKLKEMLSTTLVRDAATRKRPSLSTLRVSFFDISDRPESRSVTRLVGGSSWPSGGDLPA